MRSFYFIVLYDGTRLYGESKTITISEVTNGGTFKKENTFIGYKNPSFI